MFFRCSMNKTCEITIFVLSDNTIDYVHKTKYLGVLLCSDMKTSIDVCRQTSKFYTQANTLLRNFRYCPDDVKCMLFRSFCTNMYCFLLWCNSTSSSIKKRSVAVCSLVNVIILLPSVVMITKDMTLDFLRSSFKHNSICCLFRNNLDVTKIS